MIYIIDFLKEYSGLLVPLIIAWVIARLYFPYAAKRERTSLARQGQMLIEEGPDLGKRVAARIAERVAEKPLSTNQVFVMLLRQAFVVRFGRVAGEVVSQVGESEKPQHR